MILLIAIILFIIFLIYSIKPRSEGYTLEGLKLSWKNRASIEGVVDKWIVILKDKSGTKIHEYENSDAGNLKDFTDVTMNIVDKKEFDNRIIGDNTLELYYNKVSSDTKLYTKTVTFTEGDFGYTVDTSKLEEIDIPKPEPVDCNGYWSDWSTCSKTCGGGKTSRTWTTTTQPKNGGKACPSPSSETKDCNTQGCKVNCNGYWSGWSSCSKTCGGGTRSRTWTTTTQPKNGGTACPSPSTQYISCNTHKYNRIYKDKCGGNDFIGTYNLEQCKAKCISGHGENYTCYGFMHKASTNECRVFNSKCSSGGLPGGYTAWNRCDI
jgi:hypothetical protein